MTSILTVCLFVWGYCVKNTIKHIKTWFHWFLNNTASIFTSCYKLWWWKHLSDTHRHVDGPGVTCRWWRGPTVSRSCFHSSSYHSSGWHRITNSPFSHRQLHVSLLHHHTTCSTGSNKDQFILVAGVGVKHLMDPHPHRTAAVIVSRWDSFTWSYDKPGLYELD